MGSIFLESVLNKTGDAVGSPTLGRTWWAGDGTHAAVLALSESHSRSTFQKHIESVRGGEAAVELLINLGILIALPSAQPAWRAHDGSLFIGAHRQMAPDW